jgi:hypothetical protein
MGQSRTFPSASPLTSNSSLGVNGEAESECGMFESIMSDKVHFR